MNCCDYKTGLQATFHILSCKSGNSLASTWQHVQTYSLHISDAKADVFHFQNV